SNGLIRNATPMACLVVGDVATTGEQAQIIGLIVRPILIVMVHMKARRDRTAVCPFPNHAMQADATALEILSAQVVAKPLKLLNGCRYDLDPHSLATWMRCDTAS